MPLYLFDYMGTLDTLASPVDYLGALREQHPDGCLVIVVSGTRVPGHVAAAADDVWSKDESFTNPIKDLYRKGYREVFVCDDMPIIRRTYARALRGMGFTVTVVHPADLMTLLV